MTRPASRPISLLAALFGRMGVLFLVIVASVGLAVFFTAREQIDEVYDGQLILVANVLRALVADNPPDAERAKATGRQIEVDDTALLDPEDRKAFEAYAHLRMFRIWKGDRIVLESDTGPPTATAPTRDGFSNIDAGPSEWRVYTLRVAGHGMAVQVGERRDVRFVLVRDIAVSLALPLLLLIPIAAFLIWVALSSGLQALRALLAEIGRRSIRDLSPLPLEPWPHDLHPLVESINGLFRRIERALRQERRFLDDAAHQLRTPLAAVKLQAQMIADEDDPSERRALIGQLTRGVDRASAMTDDLLTLARLDSQTPGDEDGDLKAETVAAIADLAPLAARRNVTLSFDDEGASVGGDPVLLRLVATNLLENAINHAPEGTEVSVRLWRGELLDHLSITDAGAGIAEEERARVAERFYRAPGAPAEGSGLGLSIVTEALTLLGGRLQLRDRDDGAPGLCARVDLPRRRMT